MSFDTNDVTLSMNELMRMRQLSAEQLYSENKEILQKSVELLTNPYDRTRDKNLFYSELVQDECYFPLQHLEGTAAECVNAFAVTMLKNDTAWIDKKSLTDAHVLNKGDALDKEIFEDAWEPVEVIQADNMVRSKLAVEADFEQEKKYSLSADTYMLLRRKFVSFTM